MNAATPPDRLSSPIHEVLSALHRRYAGLADGAVAGYIPELAKADPSGFGIALATIDGHVYEVGDTRREFTIQSISKPLVYGVALEDQGRDRVLRSIGVEPTGDAFNSISLEPGTGRPLNPMINAGAIAASSLVGGATPEARLARVLGAISAYAGRPLSIDRAVYESERATGHRNRAIGHMLRNYDVLSEDPDVALELYFQQCSVRIDARDLALIAATLANGGVHPVTGAQALRTEYVQQVLSLMTTCGVYDFAGEWVCRVGMPAKSGVGGGIMAVLPGQLGLAVYSPRLDARGNSVRGVKVCEALSAELRLHFLHPPRASAAVVRARYTLAQVRSRRRRAPPQTALLDERGALARVVELQGDLRFSTVERVVREVVQRDADALMPRAVVLDFRRVSAIDETAVQMLAALACDTAAAGTQVVFSRVFDSGLLGALGALGGATVLPELDLALEWCEDCLLEDDGPAADAPPRLGLAEHGLCRGIAADDIAWLDGTAGRTRHAPGELIVQRGDASDTLYFLMRGEVSVVLPLPGGKLRRLVTLVAGMSFGETALIDGGVRGAHVRADREVECRTLSTRAFAAIEKHRPRLAIGLLHNLLRSSSETAGRLTAEVAALEG